MPTPFRLPGLQLSRNGEPIFSVEGEIGDRFSCQQRKIPQKAEDCLSPEDVCKLWEDRKNKSPFPLPLPPGVPVFFDTWTYIEVAHHSNQGSYFASPEGCGGNSSGSYSSSRYWMQWNYGSPGGKIELEVVPTSYSDGVYSRSGQNLLLRLRDRQGRLVKQWDVLYQSTGSIAGNPPCNLGSTIFDHYSLVIEDTPIPPYYEKPEDPDLDQRLEDACRKGESARPDGRSCDQFQIEVDIKKNQKTIETIADGIFWQEDMTPPYYHCQEIKEQICPDGQILCGSPSTGCCFDCGTASKKISRISENLNLILRRF